MLKKPSLTAEEEDVVRAQAQKQHLGDPLRRAEQSGRIKENVTCGNVETIWTPEEEWVECGCSDVGEEEEKAASAITTQMVSGASPLGGQRARL